MKVFYFTFAVLTLTAITVPGQVLENQKGLHQTVEIVRDKAGVPHIRAKKEADAYFGLGFVQAQDRLWQLEYFRRLGYGTLAEVLGKPGLQGDMLFRVLGVSQSAAATWKTFTGEDRDNVLAFVAGINAATDMLRQKGLPPEFGILKHNPKPFVPEDVVVIAKVLAWATDQNWTQELLRLQLMQLVGPQRAAQLMPGYTADGPVILPSDQTFAKGLTLRRATSETAHDSQVLAALIRFHEDIAARCGVGGQGIGSSNVVVNSDRSVTRKPLLAADPHLPSQLPSMMYRAHVSGGPVDAIGASLVGLPGITMGHNGKMAWGWTNVNADVQDIYIENIQDGKYLYDGQRYPVEIRVETIQVLGGSPITVPVRSVRGRPLISDLVSPTGPALSLRWAVLDTDDDAGVRALLASNRANNADQFVNAFRGRKAHPQNMVYAHKGGDIGYLLAGTIPIRGAGDGTAPIPGWLSGNHWKGYIPFEELPAARNPQQGFLTSSNNQVAPAGYPYQISSSYAAPYRAMRMRQLISARTRLAPEDLQAMQMDLRATHADELMKFLLSVPVTGSNEAKALAMLKNWDLRATSTSAATPIFEAWYIQLAIEVFGDELGPLFGSWSNQMHMVSMALSNALLKDPSWCDDTRTVGTTESCAAIASAALTKALKSMAEEQGTDDLTQWQWGKVHMAIFSHQPFDADPQLASIFSRSEPSAGDKHTLNVASSPTWTDHHQRHLAVYRQVIDLGDFDNSRWMAVPGQSGVNGSPHYDDMIQPWLRGDYHPMAYSKKAVDAVAQSTLELVPAK